jgi:hypothetical protein
MSFKRQSFDGQTFLKLLLLAIILKYAEVNCDANQSYSVDRKADLIMWNHFTMADYKDAAATKKF